MGPVLHHRQVVFTCCWDFEEEKENNMWFLKHRTVAALWCLIIIVSCPVGLALRSVGYKRWPHNILCRKEIKKTAWVCRHYLLRNVRCEPSISVILADYDSVGSWGWPGWPNTTGVTQPPQPLFWVADWLAGRWSGGVLVVSAEVLNDPSDWKPGLAGFVSHF